MTKCSDTLAGDLAPYLAHLPPLLSLSDPPYVDEPLYWNDHSYPTITGVNSQY